MDIHDTSKNSYGSVAWFYERLSSVYSAGQIRAAKLSQVEELHPGDKVLYVGMGCGEDAIVAARRGADLTCIDLAPQMINRTRQRFEKANITAEFICCDVMTHDRIGHYDKVVANFFLNVFPEPVMRNVLAHLVTLLKPGGKLLIADFAPVKGNPILRSLHSAYYWTAIIFYWSLHLEPLHPIYDYSIYLPELGLEQKPTKNFRLLKFGLSPFHSITAVKRAAQSINQQRGDISV